MRKELINLLNRISGITHMPADKLAHFGVNFVLALSAFWNFWFAVGICVGASVGKEFGDSLATGNKWSWGDIVADFVGMAAGLAISVGLGGFHG